MHVLKANYENESYYPLKEKSIIFLLITPKLSVLKVELSNTHFQPNSHSCDGKNPLLPYDIFFIMRPTHTKKNAERNLRIFDDRNACTYFAPASSNYFTT